MTTTEKAEVSQTPKPKVLRLRKRKPLKKKDRLSPSAELALLKRYLNRIRHKDTDLWVKFRLNDFGDKVHDLLLSSRRYTWVRQNAKLYHLVTDVAGEEKIVGYVLKSRHNDWYWELESSRVEGGICKKRSDAMLKVEKQKAYFVY